MNNSNKPSIGVIGLGIMGLAMATNLKKAGYAVNVFNRSPKPRSIAAERGLNVLESPQAVASTSDGIIVMVTDPAAVRNVLTGPNGVFSADVKGKTLIQMSTIDEDSTLAFAAEAQAHGLAFLDCPVAGSKKQVEDAHLILLAGADEDLLNKWRPVLLAMGKAIIHAGSVGKGTALKLCMNLIVAQMTTALCEATALAKVQGVDPLKIFQAIGESPALNCGYFKIKEKALLNEDYAPAFSLNNMLKDVRFMDAAAREKKLGLPVTQAVKYVMEIAAAQGYGAEDLTSLVKVLTPVNRPK